MKCVKTCCTCKQLKPVDEFYGDKTRKDGLDPRCKCCSKTRLKKYLSDNRKVYLAALKKYYNKTKYIRQKKKREYRNKKAMYSSFKQHKYFYIKDNVLCGNNDELLVSCKECGILFQPTNSQVQHRIEAISNRKEGLEDWEGNKSDIYCSVECKAKSKIYNVISTNPYSNNSYCKGWGNIVWKRKLRNERDRGVCWYPQCDCENKTDLVLHHINYNKQDCSKKNLITICKKGNRLAESNKEWHQTYFQALMISRGIYE